MIGPPAGRVCHTLLHTLQHVFELFGVQLAAEKTEGPVTTIKFLGTVIVSELMECRLPGDKVEDLRGVLSVALGSKKIQLRSLQSLLGKLNFACRIMPMGRIFCRRLVSAMSGVRAPHHYVRLTAEHKEDLQVWQLFLEQSNGWSLWMGEMVSDWDLDLFTDAAGAVGYGAILGDQWCAGRWPDSWREAGLLGNLVLLEPIVLAVDVWQKEFMNKSMRFHCDNLGVVQGINKVSASSPPVVRFLRRLVLQCLCLNCFVCVVICQVSRTMSLMPCLACSGTDSMSWRRERSSMGGLGWNTSGASPSLGSWASSRFGVPGHLERLRGGVG